jgi:transcriptional regulator with XRE-family HTH domain
MNAHKPNLGQKIKEIRESRGLSQQQLADLANVTQSTISQIERNEKDPSLSTVTKVSAALNVHIAILFMDDNVHVFDMDKLKEKYNQVDKLTPHMYAALGKVIRYAEDIGFIRGH